MSPEHAELVQLRSRVSELEAAQRQLEIYAEDLRRTFAELRRQLGYMNELHRVSTMIGSVLEPGEVLARTLEGVGRLVANDAACIYLIEETTATRAACLGDETLLPPDRLSTDDLPLAQMFDGSESDPIAEDARSLAVAMRASGVVVGVLYIVRSHGAPLVDDDRKLAELVAAE